MLRALWSACSTGDAVGSKFGSIIGIKVTVENQFLILCFFVVIVCGECGRNIHSVGAIHTIAAASTGNRLDFIQFFQNCAAYWTYHSIQWQHFLRKQPSAVPMQKQRVPGGRLSWGLLPRGRKRKDIRRGRAPLP